MMKRMWMACFSLFLALVFFMPLNPGHWAWGAQKVRFGTPLKINPLHALPMLAGQEKGFWKGEGVEVEWMAFKGGGPMNRGVAAGAVDMIEDSAISAIRNIGKGVPIIIVADVGGVEPMYIWVPTNSPIKSLQQLKGTKIGITRLGGLGEAYGKVISKGLKMEGQIKLVATGGIVALGAAIKSGAVDGILSSLLSQAPLKYKGEIKELVAAQDFLPEKWSDRVISVRREFLPKNHEPVKRVVKGFLKSTAYIAQNEEWAVQKMISFSGFSETAARGIYPVLKFRKEGTVDPKALESVLNFLREYGLVTAKQAAAIRIPEAYRPEFAQ